MYLFELTCIFVFLVGTYPFPRFYKETVLCYCNNQPYRKKNYSLALSIYFNGEGLV